jgi:hypothetical protein
MKPSQLLDLTDGKDRPTFEHLKLHCDQAQRLRTMELEEKNTALESRLEMANMEARVQQGYISNLKVYQGIVNGYILQLKESLRRLEPSNPLLNVGIPAMPEKKEEEMEVDSGLVLLSEAVEGMRSAMALTVEMGVFEMEIDTK